MTLEAGKYYYIVGLQKGTESTDSLSAGVRLPSGRFMRPITKEILQWRMPGKQTKNISTNKKTITIHFRKTSGKTKRWRFYDDEFSG